MADPHTVIAPFLAVKCLRPATGAAELRIVPSAVSRAPAFDLSVQLQPVERKKRRTAVCVQQLYDYEDLEVTGVQKFSAPAQCFPREASVCDRDSRKALPLKAPASSYGRGRGWAWALYSVRFRSLALRSLAPDSLGARLSGGTAAVCRRCCPVFRCAAQSFAAPPSLPPPWGRPPQSHNAMKNDEKTEKTKQTKHTGVEARVPGHLDFWFRYYLDHLGADLVRGGAHPLPGSAW